MDFLPTLPVFAAYLVAVLIIIFTPGQDMTLFLGKAVRQGRAAGSPRCSARRPAS